MSSGDIIIGVYEESGELVGYKADSFWSLTRHRDCAKPHPLVAGKIPEHLIKNLRGTLKTDGKTLIGVLQRRTKERHHDRFETRLIGYERDGERTFTHRVFDNDVQELSDEDLAEVMSRLSELANLHAA